MLFIMRLIEAMFGLSSTFSWTHSSTMWIHLNISVVGLSLNVGSMRFEIVPSLQFSMPVEMHQCKHTMLKKKIIYILMYYFFFLKKKRGILLFYIHTLIVTKVLHILPITKRSNFLATYNLQNQHTKTKDI